MHSLLLPDTGWDTHVTDDTFSCRKQSTGGSIWMERTASNVTSCTFEDNQAVR